MRGLRTCEKQSLSTEKVPAVCVVPLGAQSRVTSTNQKVKQQIKCECVGVCIYIYIIMYI